MVFNFQRCKEIKRMQRESSESISNGEQLENQVAVHFHQFFFPLKTPPQFAFKENKGCFPYVFQAAYVKRYGKISVSFPWIPRNLEVTFALVPREGQDSRVRSGRPNSVTG